jgi:hypothetical protein
MINTTGKTFQQVSDEIAAKLVQQGCQCTSDHDSDQCLYGDWLGNHCAAGWLLPPDLANRLDGTLGISMLLDEHSAEIGENAEFIAKYKRPMIYIQELHDVPEDYFRITIALRDLIPDFNGDAWLPWVKLIADERADAFD